MTLKVTQGHRNVLPLFDQLLLVVCSNNEFIWHRFRDYSVYVTAGDLEMSSFSQRQLKLQATCAVLIHM